MNLIRKRKLLFFINSYSDYLGDFVEALEKSFRVQVFLTQKNTIFTNYKIKNKITYNFINRKNFNKKLENFSPEIIIVGGFKHFLIKKIIEYKIKNNTKLFLWLERIKKNFLFKKKIYSFSYNYIFKSCDGILAIGKEAYNYYRSLNKNTFLIPYNVNCKIFKRQKCKKNEINILFVGQLIERKGINIILKALKSIDHNITKKIKITFVGNGLLNKKISNFKSNNNFPKINLYNFLSRKKLLNIYSKNNIFLFPSLYDGWGVAAAEAMASGMALIISKNCGISEFVKNNKNGIVIESNSSEISRAIKYYSHKPKNIISHGKRNFQFIKKSLLNSRMAYKAFILSLRKFS